MNLKDRVKEPSLKSLILYDSICIIFSKGQNYRNGKRPVVAGVMGWGGQLYMENMREFFGMMIGYPDCGDGCTYYTRIKLKKNFLPKEKSHFYSMKI